MSELTKLHIIEPTLQSEAGHCYGYVTSILEASMRANLRLELWVGNKAVKLFEENIKVYEDQFKVRINVHTIFRRRLRRIQTFFIFRRLLKLKQAIFVPTAGRADLVMLELLLRGKHYNNIFLHFHQFTVTDTKLELLHEIARNHPEFNILAPTQDILSIFIKAGFKNCRVVPCPSYERSDVDVKASGIFGKLLYAGVARQDKGFSDVVALVQHLNSLKSNVPIVIQISPNHSGRYEKIIQDNIAQLRSSDYQWLKFHEQTLTKEEYQLPFEDAICLQLYDAGAYSDKFSGVTLDALYAGCPIVTTDGTWISETVKRFNAGVVIDNKKPETIFAAVQKIISSFTEMQNNALHAGKILRQEHDPLHTLMTIKQMFKE